MRRFMVGLFFSAIALLIMGCPPEDTLSSAKSIVSFDFASPAATGAVFENTREVSIYVPYGTALTALVPTIRHTGISISPASGMAMDFTNPVTYTVTAEDGTTQAYVARVRERANQGKAITAFSFTRPAAAGIIDEARHAIEVTVPFGTALSALVPTITHSGILLLPSSGVAQDFSSPRTYTVTAADSTTQAYTVTVAIAPNTAKAITGFSFASPMATGLIDEAAHTISITVPYGTDRSSLVPTIVHSGRSVEPASGRAVDFSLPVTYRVTAEDGSSQAYEVSVIEALNSAKAITSFAFIDPETEGRIDEGAKTISLTLPLGTAVSSLVATFVTTGSRVAVNGVEQVSGATPNDFTDTVRYDVFADDGTSATYAVVVKHTANLDAWIEHPVTGMTEPVYWDSVAISDDGSVVVGCYSEGGVYLSTDGGDSWARCAGAGTHEFRAVAISSDGTRIAAASYDGHFYTSSDKGGTWGERTTAPSHAWVSIASSADGTRLAGVGPGESVWTSADSGATWVERDAVDEVWSAIASSADGMRLVATAKEGDIYVSADGGETWSRSYFSNDMLIYWEAVDVSTDGEKIAAVCSHLKLNGNTSLTHIGFVLYSDDGGLTWSLSQLEYELYTVAISDDGTKLATARMGGPILTSEDGAATWTARASGSWRAIAATGDWSRLVAFKNYTMSVYISE